MLNHIHKAVNDAREELKSSSYGAYFLVNYHANKNGVKFSDALDMFKAKYPELYPFGEVNEDH